MGFAGEREGLVSKDVWSDLTVCAPSPTKQASDATLLLREFIGDRKVLRFHSDNAPELKKAIQDLEIPRSGGQPGVPQSRGHAEQA